MKFDITHVQFVNPVHTYRGKVIKSAAPGNRDTIGWRFELLDNGLLCTERDGRQQLVPLANVAAMRVQEDKPEPKKSAKKAK